MRSGKKFIYRIIGAEGAYDLRASARESSTIIL
jgi:hypothetical protein